ncbi:MAG: LemA family protein, partial [Rhodocyclaceae bacterium]|nr:LemA family protein [Rhodocyclaceae bacterium]
MSVSAIALLAFIAIALLYGIVIYNNLVRLKHAIAKAWANIDVLLKQRHDELPKLVEVCRQYKQFEETTLTRVIEARARVSSARADHDVPALGAAEGMLRMGLGQLF